MRPHETAVKRTITRPVDRASTIHELAAEYLRRYLRPPYKRPSSIRNDHSMLRRIIIPQLGALKVEDVGRRRIEDLRDSLSATPYQANRVLSLLSRMFTLCEQWDLELHPGHAPLQNPVKHVKRLEEEKSDRWLRRDELKRLLFVLKRHQDQDQANAVRLIILTGARKSEVLRAAWKEFDFDQCIWTKPSHHVKQRRKHYVALNAAAVALLRAMKRTAQGPSLFPGRPGVRDTRGDLYRFWDEVRQSAKLSDVRLHDLRHTFASVLVSSGESLELVGELLGHTDPRTTRRYSHLASQPLREASNRFGKFYREVGGRRKRSR